MLQQLDDIMYDLKQNAEFIMIEDKDTTSYFIDKDAKVYRLSNRIGAIIKRSFSLKLVDDFTSGTKRRRVYRVPKITR